jgi:hypothetical protein
MNSMQRQIAKARGKGGENTAKVSVLLNDFEDADKMLTKVSRTGPSFIGIFWWTTPLTSASR